MDLPRGPLYPMEVFEDQKDPIGSSGIAAEYQEDDFYGGVESDVSDSLSYRSAQSQLSQVLEEPDSGCETEEEFKPFVTDVSTLSLLDVCFNNDRYTEGKEAISAMETDVDMLDVSPWGPNSSILGAVDELPLTEQPVMNINMPNLSESPLTVNDTTKTYDTNRYREIAHSARHVAWIQKYQIPWIAEYMIAVVMSRSQEWKNITENHISQMQGSSNAEVGPRIASILLDGERILSEASQVATFDLNPCTEFDKEENALNSGYGNLGLQNDNTLGPWWGGKVEQRAKLCWDTPRSMCLGHDSRSTLCIHLLPPECRRKSNQLAREHGSRRFLRVTPKFDLSGLKPHEKATLNRHLRQGHILLGRVYRYFFVNAGVFRLVETNENIDRVPEVPSNDARGLSLFHFVESFNPVFSDLNADQAISKWKTRFGLGLSTSIPACIFALQDILFENDIVSQRVGATDTLGSVDNVMTDGCGRINRAALVLIMRQAQLSELPSAVQGRIAGAKGLWILDKNDWTNAPRIWITESQVKIRYSNTELLHPSRRIFNLLRVSETQSPVSLSNQPIVNMAHNGVPHSVFTELLEDALKEELDHFKRDWEADDGVKLFESIFSKGGLRLIRKRRAVALALKEFGYRREEEESNPLETIKTDVILNSDYGPPGPNHYSGWPSEPSEQIVELLQAGFTPMACPLLGELIQDFMKSILERMTSPCHLPVKESIAAFAVPDFSGTLRPGEVFFRSSKSGGLFELPLMADGIARGPVVIYRYPIRTAGDARLFTAVDCEALYHLSDVAVFSTTEIQSPLSLLAGGDYDGDVVSLIFSHRIVTSFVTAHSQASQAPRDLLLRFDKLSHTVSNLRDRIAGVEAPVLTLGLQDGLLSDATRDDVTGFYSSAADVLGYYFGYDSPDALYMSHMFYHALDSEKSGLHAKAEIILEDKTKTFKWKKPACLEKRPSHDDAASNPNKHHDANGYKPNPKSSREQNLGPFVLDTLNEFATSKGVEYSRAIKDLSPAGASLDRDLVKPWMDAKEWTGKISGLSWELDHIERFISERYSDWAQIFKGNRKLSRQERLIRERKLAEQFQKGPSFPLPLAQKLGLENIMAARAYIFSMMKGCSPKFVMVVAFRTLARVKAVSHQDDIPIRQEFYECLVPRRGFHAELESR